MKLRPPAAAAKANAPADGPLYAAVDAASTSTLIKILP
jgi:hypothetical protein